MSVVERLEMCSDRITKRSLHPCPTVSLSDSFDPLIVILLPMLNDSAIALLDSSLEGACLFMICRVIFWVYILCPHEYALRSVVAPSRE